MTFCANMVKAFGDENVVDSAFGRCDNPPTITVRVHNVSDIAKLRFDNEGGNSLLSYFKPVYFINGCYIGAEQNGNVTIYPKIVPLESVTYEVFNEGIKSALFAFGDAIEDICNTDAEIFSTLYVHGEHVLAQQLYYKSPSGSVIEKRYLVSRLLYNM